MANLWNDDGDARMPTIRPVEQPGKAILNRLIVNSLGIYVDALGVVGSLEQARKLIPLCCPLRALSGSRR